MDQTAKPDQPTAADKQTNALTRREVTAAIMGAFGLSALAGCQPDGEGGYRLGAVTEALNGTTNIQWVDTVTSLRALAGGANYVAILEGYSTVGDGGGGLFVWNTVAAKDDGGTRFNSGGLGSNSAGWRRVYAGDLNVRWFGAKGDGSTDDSAAFNNCLSFASTTNTAFLIDGPLYLNSSIVILGNVQLLFVGNGKIKLGSGKTVTLGQVPQAGLWQIFDLSSGGVVLMPPLWHAAEVWAEWWGANGDASTNLSNEVAINAAMVSMYNGGAGAGGTVRLGAGDFFISSAINIQNYCSIRGLNNWTLIKANPAINFANVGGIMINATNATAMFDSRLENLRISASNLGGVGSVVNVTAWNQRCGIFNCTIYEFLQYGLYYSQGVGGAAHMELRGTDFFPNDVNNAIGAYFTNTASVGWMKLELYQCSFASGGVNATTGLMLNNRIIAVCTGVDIESIKYGITLTTAATLAGAGLSAGGGAGISAIVYCAGSWTSPGYVNISGVHKGAATAMLADSNRAYACAALEPWDGQLVWPPSLTRPAGVCVVTGGSSPALGATTSFGVCSKNSGATIAHQAVGQQRLTYATTMDGGPSQFAIAQSMDPTAPIVSAVAVSSTQIDIYTKTGAGVAADSNLIFLQIFHTP